MQTELKSETGLRILIADPDLSYCLLIKTLLAKLAREIIEIQRPSDIPELAQSFRPDWLILDEGWMDSNGLAVVEQVLVKCPPMKLILLTAAPPPRPSRESLEGGVCHWVHRDDLLTLRRLVQFDTSTASARPRF